MSGEKTELPTQRRIEEARRKGEGVGRSQEFAMAFTLGAAVIGLQSLLPGMVGTLSESMRGTIIGAGDAALDGAVALVRLGEGLSQVVTLTLPLALLVMAVGIAANLASGGLVLSAHAVRFDLSRLNPITGIRRLADKQALLRLGIAVAKLAILGGVTWQVVMGRLPGLVALNGTDTASIGRTALEATLEIGLMTTIFLAVIALVDFIVQRRRAIGTLKMTKQEVKQEHRESDGDPLVAAQRRRRARQLALGRMMDAVKTADVVVTNPIRLAVALKYDSLSMKAPRIVAKGQRLMAARIREMAREHGVPIVEDVPLARALITRPIGSEVPQHLYRAVARILVVVQQTRFGVRRSSRSAGANRPTRPAQPATPALLQIPTSRPYPGADA